MVILGLLAGAFIGFVGAVLFCIQGMKYYFISTGRTVRASETLAQRVVGGEYTRQMKPKLK